ncbi:MAG: adenylate/guanylate cyclase with Chase sensor, partial [Thermoleophilia bacterium]|nr:adenylate/guanylate cyclase with Chase sensor [Thermoleophilia bacterium]
KSTATDPAAGSPLYITDADGTVIAGTRPELPIVEGATLRLDGPAGAVRRLHAPAVLDERLLARANDMTSSTLFAANRDLLVTATGRQRAPRSLTAGYGDLRIDHRKHRALLRPTASGTWFGAAVPTSVMAASSRAPRTQLWLFFAALTGLAGLVAWIVTSAVDGALSVFSSRARRVADGHLDERIPVVGDDEVAAASTAFNTMAAALKDRIEGLEIAEARLDRQVHLFGDVLTSEDAVERKLAAVCQVATETTAAEQARFWVRSESQFTLAASLDVTIDHAVLAPHEVAALRTREIVAHDEPGLSIIVAPALCDDECVGMLTLCSTTAALDANDRELAQRLAAQAAVAVDNAHLHEALRDEHQLLARSFSQYVPASVVEQLLERGETVELGGQQREVSVLFCDIRGFTAWSEQLAPTQVVTELNELLSVLSDCVFETEGTLDKFTGDGLMALWSAPLDQADHADRACETARLMVERLHAFNESRGIDAFRIGIGIHSGPAVVGNIGHDRRHDYTAIGDTVNLSARIEAATKELGSAVLISRDTLMCSGELTASRFREVGAISVKGRTAQVVVYRPVEDPAALRSAA